MNQLMAWNDCFSYKLKECELKNPTEILVTSLLLSYLKEFNYDTSNILMNLNHESKEEQMKMKVRLCSIINKFYKISSDKNVFQYFDLIHPSPKKIQHIVTNLLNYYLWYAQTKSKILDKTENILKDRDNSEKALRKFKNEKESIKARSKNVRFFIIPMIPEQSFVTFTLSFYF